jgi:hypothetical protein
VCASCSSIRQSPIIKGGGEHSGCELGCAQETSSGIHQTPIYNLIVVGAISKHPSDELVLHVERAVPGLTSRETDASPTAVK